MTFIIDTDRINGDTAYREELRFRCITDHLFLAPLLGYTDFIPRIHQPAADLYVKKKPGLPIPEQDSIKFRMHLDPRGTYKTTMGIVDTVQWICADPDITIANETATQPLSKALTNTAAANFWKKSNAAPTAFQLIFPEHVVDKLYGESFWSPARTRNIVEPTIYSTSVGTSQSGWHPWILNPDDPVNTINSGIDASPQTRQSVINMYRTDKNTLRFGGYIHIRGTRYHPFELYGDILDKMNPEEWKVLIRAALTVRGGARLTPGEFPEEHEVILNFPELLPYDRLRSMFFEDYESFMCQQMNDPQGGAVSTFTEDMYGQALLPAERITPMGQVKICWRIASSAKPFLEKWDEGVAVRIENGHAYVIDAWRGMYTPSSRAEKIVAACKKHQCGELEIEDVPGARANDATIMNEAHRRNLSLRINWTAFEADDFARSARIKQLEPLMRSGRFSISQSMGQHTEFKRQLVHFGLIAENGLVDCAARIAAALPSTLLREEIEDLELELHRRQRERGLSAMVYGQQALEQREREEREFAMANAPQNTSMYRGLPPLPGGLIG